MKPSPGLITLIILLAIDVGATHAAPRALPDPAAPATVARTGRGTGVVRAIDLAAGVVTLRHGPIAALGWPGMTMPFKVGPATSLKALKPGQTVDFTVEDTAAGPLIVAIHPR